MSDSLAPGRVLHPSRVSGRALAAGILLSAQRALVARGNGEATGRAIAQRWGLAHTSVDRMGDPKSGVAIALGDVLALPRELARQVLAGALAALDDGGDVPVLYALPGRRADELATLRARVTELEAIATEASRTADEAARLAEALALRLATAEATADTATVALTHALAHNDRLSADLRSRDSSPRVVAELARTEAAPRKARLAPKPPAPTHPIAALKEHLRRRSR